MKKKGVSKFLVILVAIIFVLGAATTAYAAVNSTTYTKVGDQYVVDTVTAETTVDGVLVQTIERKWIPEGRFNKDNPRVPVPTSNQPSGKNVDTLRNAGIASRNDLAATATKYQWATFVTETSANDSKVTTTIKFQLDESASADRWTCTFNQVVTFDSVGNTVVKYYIGDQDYTASSIKQMFANYGKAR